MFKKILYPTDFSDISKKALGYIKKLNSSGAEEVIVLRVINEKKVECISQSAAWLGMEVQDFVEQTYKKLTDEAEEEMKNFEIELQEAGFDTKAMILRGDPCSKILEVAKQEDISIIILGSHGRSNLSSALLGSVSDYIVRHSSKPVLVVKRDSYIGINSNRLLLSGSEASMGGKHV